VDLYGDIAEELGDEASAQRRFEAVRLQSPGVFEHDESRVVYFLGKRGLSSALSWQWVFLTAPEHPFWGFARERLGSKSYLLYESSWLNRRLGRSAQCDLLVDRLLQAGAQVVRSFAHGKDCIDSGGETPGYLAMKPDQAREMAQDWWGRDAHRAQGILSLSPRATLHLRTVFPEVDVIDFASLCREFSKGEK
jgi:hypothetical protein